MAINKITWADIAEFEISLTLDEYQRIATKTAVYPGSGSPLGLMYVALKGAGEAGEFAEHVGKAMRDDNFAVGLEYGVIGAVADSQTVYQSGVELLPERRDALIKEIGDQLWYLSAKCNELGLRLSEAALINLQKLCSRVERGKLQGSGDDR